MNKFKIGDKVIVHDLQYLKNNQFENEIFTVVEIIPKNSEDDYPVLKFNEYFGAYTFRCRLANSQIIKEKLGIK